RRRSRATRCSSRSRATSSTCSTRRPRRTWSWRREPLYGLGPPPAGRRLEPGGSRHLASLVSQKGRAAAHRGDSREAATTPAAMGRRNRVKQRSVLVALAVLAVVAVVSAIAAEGSHGVSASRAEGA